MSQNDFMSQNDDDEWDFDDGPPQQPQPQQQQQYTAAPAQQPAPAIVPPPAGKSPSIYRGVIPSPPLPSPPNSLEFSTTGAPDVGANVTVDVGANITVLHFLPRPHVLKFYY
jgi:hypothetical protein